MPTNRTKRTRSHKGLDYWKIDQLVTGMFWGIARTGYTEPYPKGWNHFTEQEEREVYDAVRADWEKIGSDFMAWWRGDTEQFTAVYASIGGRRRDPSITPWAAAHFGEPK